MKVFLNIFYPIVIFGLLSFFELSYFKVLLLLETLNFFFFLFLFVKTPYFSFYIFMLMGAMVIYSVVIFTFYVFLESTDCFFSTLIF